MSDYPAWWNKAVTLYGRDVGADGRTRWQRRTLRGVFVSFDTVGVREVGASGSGGGVDAVAVLRIPPFSVGATGLGGAPAVGDIVVLGEVADEIDDYTPGKSAAALLAKYRERPGAAEIARVTDNTGFPGGHWHVLSAKIGYYGR